NVSCSGKTRLLLEGLCLNWGFYYTATVDCFELGSKDMDEALRCLDDQGHFHDVLPSRKNLAFGPYLGFNRQYTYRLFSHALLGHLLFFTRFSPSMLETLSADDCRRRWLGPNCSRARSPNQIVRDPLQEFMETALLDCWVFQLTSASSLTPSLTVASM
ncbi:hypothetical protein ARMGADRAFT_1136387, partial [Armillaria gallica]